MKKFILIIILIIITPLFIHAYRKAYVPILMYHHIRVPQPGDDRIFKDLSCPPEYFRQHLSCLASANYHTITFYDLNNFLNNKAPLPKNPIILTFDDGYENNWQAFLELKKRGMKGVFFIVYNYINGKNHLTAANIRTMADNNMEIGSHTLNHDDLAAIKPALAAKSIAESKVKLESVLNRSTVPAQDTQPTRDNKTIISFCYPYGNYNDAVLETVKKHYLFARTTAGGVTSVTGNNYLLKTVRIHNFTHGKSLMKMLGH
ncbi:MAG: polysaccharide deacetylase family protein [Candidatus Margulisiibacteriota bacterium]